MQREADAFGTSGMSWRGLFPFLYVLLAASSLGLGVTSCDHGDMMSGMMSGGMMDARAGMGGGGMMGDRRTFATNGETIFRTGRNLNEVVLQDLDRSTMKMAHSCEMCHGRSGEGGMMMMGRAVPSIRFADLSSAAKHRVPYTDDLIRRFLEQELKSDGTVAQTGVTWKMLEADESDLIGFLKTL